MDGLRGRDVVVIAAIGYVELEVCADPNKVLVTQRDPVPQGAADAYKYVDRDA